MEVDIITIYKEILDGRRKRFPRNFLKQKNINDCKIVFYYLFNNVLKLTTEDIIELINITLKENNSCLEYVKILENEESIVYQLSVVDKFIDPKYNICITYTEGFDELIRMVLRTSHLKESVLKTDLRTIIINK